MAPHYAFAKLRLGSIVHCAFPMISFGELRKKSVEWQTEISTVEKIYARDWLIKALFESEPLRDGLILRGASALASAYFADYPRVEDIDLARAAVSDEASFERGMELAVADAVRVSGLEFKLHSVQPSEARLEFTGPLGRRSAAQPLIIARVAATPPRTEPDTRPLVHPFSDTCEATIRAISLSELTAERIVLYAQKPRARDVFDLWFILTHSNHHLDLAAAWALAQTIAREKNVVLRAETDAKYGSLLERAWDNALQEIRSRPSFSQAHSEIKEHLTPYIQTSG